MCCSFECFGRREWAGLHPPAVREQVEVVGGSFDDVVCEGGDTSSDRVSVGLGESDEDARDLDVDLVDHRPRHRATAGYHAARIASGRLSSSNTSSSNVGST